MCRPDGPTFGQVLGGFFCVIPDGSGWIDAKKKLEIPWKLFLQWSVKKDSHQKVKFQNSCFRKSRIWSYINQLPVGLWVMAQLVILCSHVGEVIFLQALFREDMASVLDVPYLDDFACNAHTGFVPSADLCKGL